VIYYVKPDGSKTELIDTRAQKSNTADIGFDPATKTVYVPTFFKNKVVAYRLK
jgi:sugar lactone lactonase YvrE